MRGWTGRRTDTRMTSACEDVKVQQATEKFGKLRLVVSVRRTVLESGGSCARRNETTSPHTFYEIWKWKPFTHQNKNGTVLKNETKRMTNVRHRRVEVRARYLSHAIKREPKQITTQETRPCRQNLPPEAILGAKLPSTIFNTQLHTVTCIAIALLSLSPKKASKRTQSQFDDSLMRKFYRTPSSPTLQHTKKKPQRATHQIPRQQVHTFFLGTGVLHPPARPLPLPPSDLPPCRRDPPTTPAPSTDDVSTRPPAAAASAAITPALFRLLALSTASSASDGRPSAARTRPTCTPSSSEKPSHSVVSLTAALALALLMALGSATGVVSSPSWIFGTS